MGKGVGKKGRDRPAGGVVRPSKGSGSDSCLLFSRGFSSLIHVSDTLYTIILVLARSVLVPGILRVCCAVGN